MKKFFAAFFIVISISIFNLTGCNRNNVIGSNLGVYNIPVLANTPNAFSFLVNAYNYNYSDSHLLQINADTLTVAITITGHSNGTGSIIVKDDKGESIYQKSFESGIVATDVFKISAEPKSVNLSFSNYTGKITIAVAGK